MSILFLSDFSRASTTPALKTRRGRGFGRHTGTLLGCDTVWLMVRLTERVYFYTLNKAPRSERGFHFTSQHCHEQHVGLRCRPPSGCFTGSLQELWRSSGEQRAQRWAPRCPPTQPPCTTPMMHVAHLTQSRPHRVFWLTLASINITINEPLRQQQAKCPQPRPLQNKFRAILHAIDYVG